MNTLDKTGVPTKYSGDGLSHIDINSINSVTNANVDATNMLLKNFCNVNDEINSYTRTFTLEEAINQVPNTRRKPGITIKYLDIFNVFREYTYSGPDVTSENWTNVDYWYPGANEIDGGVW